MTTPTEHQHGRPFAPPTKILWRIGEPVPGNRGEGHNAPLVAYLTADQCADLLDRWVGPFQWTVAYKPQPEINALWCGVTVHHPDQPHPLTKWDCGEIGDSIKAASADAFKRCVMRAWGLGRDIRMLPSMWAPVGVRPGKNAAGQDVQVGYSIASTHTTLAAKLNQFGYGGFSADVEGDTTRPEEAEPAEVAAPPAPAVSGRPDGVRQVAELWVALEPIPNARAEWLEWKCEHGTNWAASADTVAAAYQFMSDLADRYLPQEPAA